MTKASIYLQRELSCHNKTTGKNNYKMRNIINANYSTAQKVTVS